MKNLPERFKLSDRIRWQMKDRRSNTYGWEDALNIFHDGENAPGGWLLGALMIPSAIGFGILMSHFPELVNQDLNITIPFTSIGIFTGGLAIALHQTEDEKFSPIEILAVSPLFPLAANIAAVVAPALIAEKTIQYLPSAAVKAANGLEGATRILFNRRGQNN